MNIPGFVAERCLDRISQTEFGVVYTSIYTSRIVPSTSDICYEYHYSCKQGCKGLTGDDFDFCMCQCKPDCFCEFM